MVIINYEEDGSLALGTLESLNAISGATKIDATRLQGYRIAKVDLSMTVKAKTAAEGPICFGIACNMSAAEVEKAIEADPQSSTDDNERGEGGWLKMLGIIPVSAIAGPITGTISGAAQMITVMVNWSVIEGKEFTVWAYNMGAQLTTGTIISWIMEIFGVWLRD